MPDRVPDLPWRLLRCPFCGHETRTKSVGVVSCGPHRLSDGTLMPARGMVAVNVEDDDV